MVEVPEHAQRLGGIAHPLDVRLKHAADLVPPAGDQPHRVHESAGLRAGVAAGESGAFKASLRESIAAGLQSQRVRAISSREGPRRPDPERDPTPSRRRLHGRGDTHWCPANTPRRPDSASAWPAQRVALERPRHVPCAKSCSAAQP